MSHLSYLLETGYEVQETGENYTVIAHPKATPGTGLVVYTDTDYSRTDGVK
jgi:hypothetical protein